MLTVEQFARYNEDGYLLVPALIALDEIEAFRAHAASLLGPADDPFDRFTQHHLTHAADVASGGERSLALVDMLSTLGRVHMLHRVDPAVERMLLHPAILDVAQGLVGNDVLAIQSALIYNPPGRGGQGWHQDAFSIPTRPQTLFTTWISLDEADEETGCLRMARGSHCEPIYPSVGKHFGYRHPDEAFADLPSASFASAFDEERNTLAKVAARYETVPLATKPGDVLFFGGHVVHRSSRNRSETRWRRAFTAHYCHARSQVLWNHGRPWEGECANGQHILARGDTHLPFREAVFQ